MEKDWGENGGACAMICTPNGIPQPLALQKGALGTLQGCTDVLCTGAGYRLTALTAPQRAELPSCCFTL